MKNEFLELRSPSPEDALKWAKARCLYCHGTGYMSRARGKLHSGEHGFVRVICNCVLRRMARERQRGSIR